MNHGVTAAVREALWVPQSARALVQLATTAKTMPVIASVVGGGGVGKSALLDHLHAVFCKGDVAVQRAVPDERAVIEPGSALIIDDAHELTDAAVAQIARIMERGTSSVIVAFRPWPASASTTRLARQRGDSRVTLGAYGHDELSELAMLARPNRRVHDILEATAGMPWLVHPLLEFGTVDGTAPISLPPAEVLELSAAHSRGASAELEALLLALAAGFDLSSTIPNSVPDERLDELVGQVRAAGLLQPDGRLVPLVGAAIIGTTPTHRLRSMQRELLDAANGHGPLPTSIALTFARSGMRDPRLGHALESAADAALATDPSEALDLYAASIDAGADTRATAARRAQALVATGDLDAAGRVLDDLLAGADAPDLGLAIDTLAAIWAHRGMLAQAAATYELLDADAAARSSQLQAVALIGSGDLAAADAALELPALRGASSLVAAAVEQLAQGIRHSVDGAGDLALPTLIRSSDAMTSSRSARLLPDSPAALAAIVALHGGQLEVATSIVDAALRGEQCGPAARRRLLLLHGWTAMLADRMDDATAVIREITDGAPLAARDAYLLGGLRVGLARRLDDGPGLARAWHVAREAVLHVPVDLFSLLPLGELVVAAARTRESARVAPQLVDAWSLIERLGHPPLWSSMLHWSCVQAAVLANRPQDLRPHAEALLLASPTSPLAGQLADAARVWPSVLAGTVDVPRVEAAARGLSEAGLRWDGARLVGHAAGRAALRADMIRLLAFARDLSSTSKSGHTDKRGWHGERGTAHDGGDEQRLTARELEVARLVLDGKTYREIGAAIFLSPRTAEHHIARIRRRLGATTRSELHARLRDALERAARESGVGSDGDTP